MSTTTRTHTSSYPRTGTSWEVFDVPLWHILMAIGVIVMCGGLLGTAILGYLLVQISPPIVGAVVLFYWALYLCFELAWRSKHFRPTSYDALVSYRRERLCALGVLAIAIGVPTFLYAFGGGIHPASEISLGMIVGGVVLGYVIAPLWGFTLRLIERRR